MRRIWGERSTYDIINPHSQRLSPSLSPRVEYLPAWREAGLEGAWPGSGEGGRGEGEDQGLRVGEVEVWAGDDVDARRVEGLRGQAGLRWAEGGYWGKGEGGDGKGAEEEEGEGGEGGDAEHFGRLFEKAEDRCGWCSRDGEKRREAGITGCWCALSVLVMLMLMRMRQQRRGQDMHYIDKL